MAVFLFETYRNTAQDETPSVVAAKSGTIDGWTLLNPNEATVYLKLYNTETPTVGTTAPFAVLPIPPGDGTNPGIYLKDDNEPFRAFSKLAIAAVTGLADNSTAAPTTPIYVEIIWED
jgi:hypothetical protein